MIEEIINFENALKSSGEEQQDSIPKGLNILYTGHIALSSDMPFFSIFYYVIGIVLSFRAL